MLFRALSRSVGALVLSALACAGGLAQAPAGFVYLSVSDDPSLSAFTVRDPQAGFLDVAARRQFLAQTSDPVLRAERERIPLSISCADVMELPVISHSVRLPSFYRQNAQWRQLIRPYSEYERAVSDLGAAYVITGESYYSDCLIAFLARSASAQAFENYDYSVQDAQAWHQVEAAIFVAALNYSLVRDDQAGTPEQRAEIEAWLLRLSRRHSSFTGGEASCCNNHLYRRGFYAAMVGVLTDDDALFQYGVGAFQSALRLASADGALKLEMDRGRLAAHYQNFALIYLSMIGHIMERQGYPAFEMEINGTGFSDLVGFNECIFEDVTCLSGYAEPANQDLSWIEDDQYLAWMELLRTYQSEQFVDRLIGVRRPLYNRSTGGHMTVLFYTPAGQF